MSLRAMILAAGEGTRLRPLTAALPKPLVPVLNRPMIHHALDALRAAGVTDAIANAWYLADTLVGRLGAGPPEGPRLRWSVEPELLGTGGGLRHAAPFFDGCDDFLVFNGDVLALADLSAALAAHRASGAAATLVVTRRPDLPPTLHKVAWDRASGRVVEVDGVPGLHGPGFERGIYTGLLVGTRALIEALPAEGPACLKERGFWPLLRAGVPIHAYETGAYWSDIGSPEAYLRTHRELLDSPELPRVLPADTIEIEDGVHAHRAARVHADAVLCGPALIGPDTIVQAGATVGPHAVVGARCTLTPQARVERSVIWDGVIVPAAAVDQVWWPAGTLTARPQAASPSRP